ncbi:Mechanosensitive ion channel-domain-containing protein [Aspergillus novoparasiticus]|uniref:Mechanosensitive ion channel-domain-containing protein n=1 Tax=Aspergillus novoparasiticus TaxID=986946 RepID=A0A5N6EED0_9EURO|nr:Mechanosensitive ion channel-domain-containing protein [Aspergillus novoparasiticus]
MSTRPGLAEKRLSAHRFQQIPDYSGDGMANPNDVTIEIPLNPVPSRGQTGARKTSINPTSPDPNLYEPPGESGAEEKAALVTGPGRRKRVDSARARSVDDPEDGTLTRMGRIYQAIFNFSIITRYLIYVSPLALLIAIPIIVGATVRQDTRIGGVPLHWFFTWIEVVWLSLWVCKLVAHFLPYIFQFLVGIVSSGTRKYALILQSLQFPIATVLWAVVSLVTFLPIMTLNPVKKAENDTGTKSWEKTLKNILFALLVCSLIFLAEKAIVQLISISYHRKQFDKKIKESKRNVTLLGELYDASRSMFPMYCKEFREEDTAMTDIIASKVKGIPRSGSAPLRLIREVGQNVGRIGDKVTAAFGDVAQELTGKEVFNPNSARSIVTLALERKRSSEALARRIWMSFVIEGREALYFEDIAEVLGAGKEAEAEECFQILDRDGNGDISLDEMILTVAEIGRGRKALNHSMHDVDQAIHVLDNLLMTIAFGISVLVFVSFVTSGFGTVIAAGATSLLSLSFVFATTAQEVLGSCIFLFVKHPFDVGDRVEIDSKPYTVERISLLFSVFTSVADRRTTQVPNVVLNTLWIDNFTRSNAMHETLTIPIKFGTSFSDIELLRQEMELFVRDKENSRDFQPDVSIDVAGVGDMDKLELAVTVCHKSNWAIESVRAARRSKFMCALVAAIRKIPIRAPGAADEEPAAEDNNDDKPDGGDNNGPGLNTEKMAVSGLTATDSLHDPTMPYGDSRSTGFDLGRDSGSLQRRGGGASASSHSQGTFVDSSRSTGEGEGHDAESFRSPAASPRKDQLSVPYGTLNREPSTGRRKANSTQSTQSTQSTYPTATGGVPILAAPVPPRHVTTAPAPPPSAPLPPAPPATEYRPYSAHYYEDSPYDSNQRYELPSMPQPSEQEPYGEYPSPHMNQSPTSEQHASNERMPGAFVSHTSQYGANNHNNTR